MKKSIVLLMAVVITCTISSFAAAGPEPGKQILKTFKTNFPLAENVIWTVNKNVYTARFINNDKTQAAYYSFDGQYLGHFWQITIDETPAIVRHEILKRNKSTEIKSITLFFPPEGYPKYLAVFEANGKRSIKEVDSYGRASVVLEKKIPSFR
jgi:hypothetical protein